MAGFNLGDIFVTFKAKTDQLNDGAKKVRTFSNTVGSQLKKIDFSNFAQRAGSAFDSISSKMQTLATRVVLFAASGSLGLATFIKSAADLQIASKSFEILIGNTKKANALFAELKRFADQTPFEFPDLAKGARTLLGYGINVNDVMKRLKMLGDIAAVTGADFNSLAVVFGQVNGAGRLMGQDVLQLINNNIPVTTILTKKLGITAAELRKRIEAGAVSAKVFTDALVEYTSKGGPAFNGTAILAQTLNGRMSTLKDTVMEFGRQLIGVKVDPKLGFVIKPGGLFDRFSQLIPRIITKLTELGPKISAVGDFFVRNGKTVMAIMAGLAASFIYAKSMAVIMGIAMAASPIGAIALAVTVLVGVLTALQSRYGAVSRAIDYLKPKVMQLVDGFNKYFMPSIKALIGAVTDYLLPALMQLKDAYVRLWNSMNPALITTIKFLAKLLAIQLYASVWLVINVWRIAIKVISVLTSVFSNLGKWISNTIKLGGQFVGKLVRLFNSMPNQVKWAFALLANRMVAPFLIAFNKIASLWNATVGKLSFKIPSWVPGIGGKGFDVPDIPHFAMGTANFAGGLANMNEFGPETAVLPPGTRVITADQTRRGETGSGGGNTYVFNMKGIMARSDSELADIIEQGIKTLDRRLKGAGRPQILKGTV